MDLTLRTGSRLAEAIGLARAEWEQRQAAGMDQAALDEAARSGFALGEFEESEEDGAAVVEEFYPVEVEGQEFSAGHAAGTKPELADKLRLKAGRGALPAVNPAEAG